MTGNAYLRLKSRRDRRPGAGGGPRAPTQSPAFVGRVFGNPTVPSTTGVYYSVHPVAVLGAEGEGNPGSLVVDTSATVRVYVLGGRAPVAGDDLICRSVRHRWVADRLVQVATYYAVQAGCDCPSVPPVLTMTVAYPALNGGLFQNCTIRSTPVPAAYQALHIADASGNAYLSDRSFTDQFGDTFRWYFTCLRHQFLLTRVYVSSIFGSPFEDTARFTYIIGQPGNTCSPFAMTAGQTYAGGDPATRISISG